MNLRKLELKDFERGYLHLLSYLTHVGEVSQEGYITRFQEIQKLYPYLQIWVLEEPEKKKIIGSATLLLEPKFIHSCSKVGHIEDVVIDSRYQGKGLGKVIVEKLKEICREEGCYKVILDCSEKNRTFYEKCGFENKNIQMSCYFE
jgi:glucosamine-phosphate N-acetyltransferase